MQLRSYQYDLKHAVNAAWQAQQRNVCMVLPTGGGKTVVLSDLIKDEPSPSCAIAHRQELVGQISLALARDEVRHRIIGPDKVVKACVQGHMAELGRSYFHPGAPAAVAGIDTLIRRGEGLDSWRRSVGLWVMDEAHHVVEGNKWGKGVALFPNARGLGVTATPGRADGKGLGRSADGVFDTMVEGPTMRQLIDMGYLTDYRVFAPPSDLDMSSVKTGKDGDFILQQAAEAVKKSRVVGDVVEHYLRLARGKRGVTFAPDVETAHLIAKQFNDAGVPALAVSAKTVDSERAAAVRRLRNGDLLQLVNVDLFGEGFDLPAIEVVSMARPTQSYGLFAQQFGRALRIMDGKTVALIIDHVGNVIRHGLPDAPRVWTLDRRSARGSNAASDAIPIKVCVECLAPYERIHAGCPHCGYRPMPSARSGPEAVDGDLIELDAATLEKMRADISQIDKDPELYRAELMANNIPSYWRNTHVKHHKAKQEAQKPLRESIAWWAAWQREAGRPDSESYRRFYFAFGVDVLSAQALGAKDAEALTAKINQKIASFYVDGAVSSA